MSNKYIKYDNVTKEILDNIAVGNLIKVNDWKKPMKVVGVSENYFVMVQKNFGDLWYSVCEKKPWDGIRYNQMIGGMFHCGKDNMIFGWMGTDEMISTGKEFNYKFDNDELISEYLQAFERGDIELSVRGTIPIMELYVK